MKTSVEGFGMKTKGYALMCGSGSCSDEWDINVLAVYTDKAKAKRVVERLNKPWEWHRARAKNRYSGPYLEAYYMEEVFIK